MAVADLNGDGKPDLVTANGSYNNVSVLLGNGNGTFQAAQSFAVGTSPVVVAVADLNGDGHPDLVTANSDSNACRCCWATATAPSRRRSPLPLGTSPESVAVADVNGDGHPDLVTANAALQRRVGAAGQWRRHLPGAQALCRREQLLVSVAVADLNGDGKPDLVTANTASNDVSVLLGNGDGTFQAPQSFAVGTGPASVAVADLNGDGRPISSPPMAAPTTCRCCWAMATAPSRRRRALPSGTALHSVASRGPQRRWPARSRHRQCSIQRRVGVAGQWRRHLPDAPQPFARWDSTCLRVAIADLNGDGLPDLVTANGVDTRRTVSVLLGNGDGTFQRPQSFAVGACLRRWPWQT